MVLHKETRFETEAHENSEMAFCILRKVCFVFCDGAAGVGSKHCAIKLLHAWNELHGVFRPITLFYF